MRVRVNFALVDQAFLVVVQKFDRVFDRDHVLFALAVDLVEHGGESGGLARAGRAGDKHKTARLVAQPPDDCWKAQSIEAFDFPRNRSKHSGDRAALVENVAAKTGKALQAERKVELEVFFQAVLLRVREHAIRQCLRVRRR